MAAVDTGKSFANGEQLTAAKLNQMFGNSTFAAGAVDNSTMTVNSLGQLAVNQVTSSNIAVNTLQLDDIQQIATDKVLGRLSDETGNIEQITVDEDLTSVSATHNELATSKAIKDYIDSQINNKILGIGQSYTTVTRALDDTTEYTNNTGRPILLRFLAFYTNVSGNDDISVDIAFKIGTNPYFYMRLCDCVGFSGYASDVASIIIPDGVVYKLRNNNGDNVPQSVSVELR